MSFSSAKNEKKTDPVIKHANHGWLNVKVRLLFVLLLLLRVIKYSFRPSSTGRMDTVGGHCQNHTLAIHHQMGVIIHKLDMEDEEISWLKKK